MTLDPITCRIRLPMGAGLKLSFRDWLRRLEGSGRIPSPLSDERRAAIAASVDREQEELAKLDAAAAQTYEQWLSDHELSTSPPQTLREARSYARRVCEWAEGTDEREGELSRLRRVIDQLEARTAGRGAEKSHERGRLAKLRTDLAYTDRLVDELYPVAWPAFVGPSFGVPWREVELRKQGRGPDGSPLLDCAHCRKPDAFASEYERFVWVGRCEDCRKAGAENRAEIHRRTNEPTWLDHLKKTLTGGD